MKPGGPACGARQTTPTQKAMNHDTDQFTETSREQRVRENQEQPGSPSGNTFNEARGRDAQSPEEIPARGWRDVLKRTAGEIEDDNLPLVSAGVAFFFLLGLFPGLAAIVSIYGWIADPATVTGHIDQLSAMLPGEAAEIIHGQAEKLAADDQAAGWGAIIGVLLALWAGSKAMKGMVQALNIAYNEGETRGLIKKQALYLSLTLAMVVTGIVSILLIAILPVIVDFLPLPDWGKAALVWLRWPVLLLVAMTAISGIYRYGPSRRKAEWKWVTWGAGVATVLWLIASALFSFYVSNFGNFNETYGSLGAVIVLMTWLYLTAFLILMGAELDSEMEYQTARDTTAGGEQPMGSRDAFVADNVAGGR